MQTVDDIEFSHEELGRLQPETRPPFFERLEKRKLLVIATIFLIALGTRIYFLDAAGLAEDETNKVFALRAYEQGDFTVNAEHPMLMKMLCYGSTRMARLWNQHIGSHLGFTFSEESALRFPNALAGALTVIPLFLLAANLLGFRVALLASIFWAIGLNAIWFNRVTKEDTLMVFFMLTGFYLYNQAKSTEAENIKLQERLYTFAGAAFGLMMCSKYFPHYFGLNQLFYHIAGYDSRNNRPLTGRMKIRYFGAIFLAFVAFNPVVFLPQTWRYLLSYMREDLLTHHGYLFMDSLYSNDMGSMPQGLPWYFYLLFLGVKLPLPMLLALIVGAIEIFRHRGDHRVARGYLFLRMMLFFWLFPMAIVGSKFLRYTLALMPVIYITAAVGIWALWRWLSTASRQIAIRERFGAPAMAVILVVIFVAAPTVIAVQHLAFPNLYVNRLGSGRAGYFFPHDEFYDIGARESIRYLADHAPPGSIVASEIPGVMQYYLERYNRPDIRLEILSHPNFSLDSSRPDFVLLQRGRVYFENEDIYRFVEQNFTPVQSSAFDGAIATQLYNITGKDALVKSEPVPESQ